MVALAEAELLFKGTKPRLINGELEILFTQYIKRSSEGTKEEAISQSKRRQTSRENESTCAGSVSTVEDPRTVHRVGKRTKTVTVTTAVAS